jgi:hypothetical protein
LETKTVSASKSRLAEQPVPQALGPKTQQLRLGKGNSTLPRAPSAAGADQEFQLERWLKILVGEKNRECVMAIFEAVLILTEDIVNIVTAAKSEGSPGAMTEVHLLFKDIVMVALLLPPKCTDDPEVAAFFNRVYAIINLVSQEDFDDLSFAEAEKMINNISEISLDASLVKKVVSTLRDATSANDLETQVAMAAALLPPEALEKIDQGLNMAATDLPGASFITTLNKYDNELGVNIIPDEVVAGPAIDLLIRTARVTGLIETRDAEFLFTLTGILRREIAAAMELSPLERMKRFVERTLSPSSPPIEDAPDPGPERRRPVRIDIAPLGKEIQAPIPTGQIDEGATRRMKALAGIL